MGAISFFGMTIGTLQGIYLRSMGTVYDSGFSKEAKLSSIILNGDWFWPSAKSDTLVEIQSKLPKITLGDFDRPV
jgi:hypothetical protein